ncbi:MAG: LpxL/LpxP family acyltransferase [Ferrimicrobium sp.]
MAGAVRVTSTLPRWMDRVIYGAAGVGSYLLGSPRRRSIVRANQSVVWRWRKPLASHLYLRCAIEVSVLRAHVSYARYWVELFRLLNMSEAEVANVVVLENADEFLEQIRSRKASLAVLAHIGNWEWGGAWFARFAGGLSTVAENLSDASVRQWFLESRAQLGISVDLLGPLSTRWLLRELQRDQLVALMMDRDLSGTGEVVSLFGEEVALSRGPAMLAVATGTPIFPIAAFQERGGRVRISVWPTLSPSGEGSRREQTMELTQRIATTLEEMIATRPEQWHVFQPFFAPSINGDVSMKR